MIVDPVLYAAFAGATALLILMPGPMVGLILATAFSQGTRPAVVTVAGGSSALALVLVVFGLGLSSILLILSEWFNWIRWFGVAYLLFLAWKAWSMAGKAKLEIDEAAIRKTKLSRFYLRGFVVNATNPKTFIFFAAFFPQFVDPGLPLGPQLVLLCSTFLVIATVIDGGYALLGGHLRTLLIKPALAKLRDRLTGGLLALAGLGLALARNE